MQWGKTLQNAYNATCINMSRGFFYNVYIHTLVYVSVSLACTHKNKYGGYAQIYIQKCNIKIMLDIHIISYVSYILY